MKKIMVIVIVLAYFAFAQRVLDQAACNMGNSQNSNMGIPAESCLQIPGWMPAVS